MSDLTKTENREAVELLRSAAQMWEAMHDDPESGSYMEGVLFERFTRANALAARLEEQEEGGG
jgi:hypothetical protein